MEFSFVETICCTTSVARCVAEWLFVFHSNTIQNSAADFTLRLLLLPHLRRRRSTSIWLFSQPSICISLLSQSNYHWINVCWAGNFANFFLICELRWRIALYGIFIHTHTCTSHSTGYNFGCRKPQRNVVYAYAMCVVGLVLCAVGVADVCACGLWNGEYGVLFCLFQSSRMFYMLPFFTQLPTL